MLLSFSYCALNRDMWEAAIIVLVPFVGSALGAMGAFLLKKPLSALWEKILYGFAGGVMVAASFFSLLSPAVEEGNADLPGFGWVPVLVGFVFGVALLFGIDKLVPHLHPKDNQAEGKKSVMSREWMLFLALTIHNIPEGLAVGVGLSPYLYDNSIGMMSALMLSVGIAIQNFPEGLIASLPLRESEGRGKAVLLGLLSGIVEPIAAVIALLIAPYVEPILPYALSFAAGAMIYAVIEDLMPAKEEKHSNALVLAFCFGFALMMVLDLALG